MKSNYPLFRKGMPSIIAFLTFVLSLVSFANAATYYISPLGSDATGTGTLANPWKTLAKATSTVTTAGNTIHVNAGTYLETVQCFLAAGVNLEGDGVTSIIQSTWPWSYQGALVVDSPEGTNGNQSISYLKFDGRNMTTPRGISVQGRSNVNFHHCTIVDFKEEGVVFSGTLGFTGNAPGIYATGNSFHDNILTNCSQYAGFGTGCLGIGGQIGMLIYNNTITQPQRTAPAQIGWPIKYFNEGWLKGVKIYNNTITKAAFDGNGWNFCLELFNFQGLEIYNNNFQGSLDFNFQGNKGTYPWVCYIHDNTIAQPVLNTTNFEQGLIFEYDVDGAIIENNIFRNISAGLSFFCRPGTITKDFIVRKNLFDNIGYPSTSAYFIGAFDAGTNNYVIDNFKVYNNTFVGNTTNKPIGGISFGNCNTGYIKNVDVRNNYVSNVIYPPFSIGGTAVKDNINFSYNNALNCDQYGIGTNYAYLPNGVPTNYVNTNNANLNPLFANTVNYTLQPSSPMVDAGANVGLPFTGTAPDRGYAELSIILPVKLISFVAAENKGTNILQWTTATESNSDYFSVERSSDGQHFEAIGRVTAKGFTSSNTNYTYTDLAPLPGINYYRLVMLDKDNSKDLSNTVSVVNKKEESLRISTAAIAAGKGNMALSIISAQNQKATVAVFDVNGKVFFNEPVQLSKGTTTLNKNTAVLSAGIYYIRLTTTDETVVRNVFTQ